MKTKNFKNCIAFTLMEMTLVLLITSVIAAASTPIITSAVSDAAMKGGPDSPELSASPWKNTSTYNGGGIYNTPINSYSFIGINMKPGAYSNEAYQYATLLVNSYATGNIIRNPQIIVENVEDATSADITNVSTVSSATTKIGMDEYENILLASGSFINATDNTAIGAKSIYIGRRIQYVQVPESQLKSSNSVYMGYNINSYYASYAINIGRDIHRYISEDDVINIGSYHYANHATYGSVENVHIGSYTNMYGMGRQNVIMGRYAGYASNVMRNVIIGNYAGYRMPNLDYYKNSDNVIIGHYALYLPSKPNNAFVNNVVIGEYAGYRVGTNLTDYLFNSISIGEYAGAYMGFIGGTAKFMNSIAIGYHAGVYAAGGSSFATNRSNDIFIGNFAGLNSSSDTGKNIFIGSRAGMYSHSGDSLYIGEYAGYNTTAASNNYSNIAIGYYAGYSANGFSNIYIGEKAGYSSTGNYNVGIGRHTCKNLSASATKKWCLGYGTIPVALTKDGTTTNIWSPYNSAAQMVIGFTGVAPASQNVVLYAASVKRWGATNMDKVSDRRFKENIVPSKRSIKDIRKINIYEYNFKDDKEKAKRIGVIAQEYKKVFPNDVVRDSATKKLALSVDWMIYTMVNAVKDVDNEIKHLQNDAKIYINDFSDLKAKISKLEKQAQQIKSENEEIKSHLAEINKKLK